MIVWLMVKATHGSCTQSIGTLECQSVMTLRLDIEILYRLSIMNALILNTMRHIVSKILK